MIKQFQNPKFSVPTSWLLIFAIFQLSFIPHRPMGEVTLNAGTAVVLETMSIIRSDNVFPGQLIDLRVKYDVVAQDKVVIPAGTIAKAQVVRARKARGLGREGMIELQVRSVPAIDGKEVFLSGANVFNEGDDRQVLSIALGIFVCLLFLLLKGKNAEIPPGFQINASVATTTKINV